MENQDNLIYNEEYAVNTQENDIEKKTVEIIDASMTEVFTVDLDEAFTALGESNEQLKHTLLNGRELPDQHPITSITGLRDELDGIEALKTVYSNNKNYANYYMWQDENPLQENREGFFVSLCPTTNKIKICDFNEDIGEVSEVFGITVNSAGFIGGQDDVARDTKYGLVVYSGMATVRCASDVSVGDYVMPNRYGVAEKAVCSVVNNTGTTIEVDGKCGYLVVALDDTSGTSCADIIFNVSAKQLNDLENSIHEFNVRIDNTETNITSAINVANEAYHLASNLGDIGKLNADTVEKANDALEKAEQALGETISQSEQIAIAKKTSEEAKAIAQLSSVSAEAIRSEAVATANDALAQTNNLIDSLEPITTWADENGNTGATYLVEYIDDGLATKTEVETVSTMTEELKLQVNKSAAGIESMVSSVAIYSLGEYSQSYGLTQKQAKAILEKDAIYVPTVDHTEDFETSLELQKKIFTKGYYYIWSGENWITSDSPYVAFSSGYIVGGDTAQFWVVDAEEPITTRDGVVYEPDTLYMWMDYKWVAVADLASNPSNRIANTLRYTTNSLAAEITNARGSFTGLDARLTDVDSRLNLTTFWKDPTNNLSNLAAVQLNSDDDSSNLALVVMGKEGDQQISGASIVLGQDGANPYISLDADYINLEGFTTINNSFTIDDDGYMRATGGTIGGFTISDGAIYTNERKTIDSGFAGVHLSNQGISVLGAGDKGHIYAYASGELDIKGNITATSGTFTGTIHAGDGNIGGWNLISYWGGSMLYSKQAKSKDASGNEVSYGTGMVAGKEGFGSTSFPAFWAGYTGDYSHPYLASEKDEDWKAKTAFYVTHTGYLRAQNANIQGVITATSGSFSESVTIGGTTVTAGYLSSLYNYATGGTGTAIKQIAATKGTFGEWHIGEGDYASSMWAEHKPLGTLLSTVYLTPELVRVKKNNSTSASATWENIANSATQYALAAANDDSDANIKNSIAELDEKYEVLFDSLTPCKYKYNFGTSDRYHTGFIAQEVIQALDDADLTTSDFAAVMKYQEPDEYGSEYGLRRDEFVALNTWQIQKLKKRVAELEAKLEQKEI